jgi:hypothetical protein
MMPLRDTYYCTDETFSWYIIFAATFSRHASHIAPRYYYATDAADAADTLAITYFIIISPCHYFMLSAFATI